MNSRCTLSAVLFLSFVVLTAAAQPGKRLYEHLLIKDFNRSVSGVEDERYDGSPYLDNAFASGEVYVGENKFGAMPMRYNIYQDLIEFQDHGQLFVLQADTRITKIQIGDRVFVVASVSKKEPGYLELQESGRLSLLAKKVVHYRKKSDINGIPAKYSRQGDTYYYKLGDEPLQKIGSMKNLIEGLPDKKQELLAFEKAEKLSSRDSADLVRLVRYYNSLFGQ